MTYDEQRKLALNAEIAKLREVANGFRRLALDAQKCAHELELSTKRFQVLADYDDQVDGKIEKLDQLAAERRRIAETKGDLRGTLIDITRSLGGA